jgi:hypothetical protein
MLKKGFFMKNKKTWLGILAMVLVFGMAVVGCGDDIHTCSFSTTWAHNETQHWHECSCGEKTDVADHDFDGDICNVCGYDKKTVGLTNILDTVELLTTFTGIFETLAASIIDAGGGGFLGWQGEEDGHLELMVWTGRTETQFTSIITAWEDHIKVFMEDPSYTLGVPFNEQGILYVQDSKDVKFILKFYPTMITGPFSALDGFVVIPKDHYVPAGTVVWVSTSGNN